MSRNSVILAGILVLTALGASSIAQSPSDKKEPFDTTRFFDQVEGWFSPFYVTETKPLRKVLDARTIGLDTQVLVTETAAGRLALLTEQMTYHHIAQGSASGKTWMATFCILCNSGVSMTPTIDGKEQRFDVAGLYDGILVMKDAGTGTLWNHITGKALHGKLAGSQLPVSNLLQMNAKQALALDPQMVVAISDRPFVGRRTDPDNPGTTLASRFAATLGVEDTRRPRMDSGLGVWTAETHRYYPLERIRERGGAFMDQIAGRKVLVYLDPESSVPAAIFVDSDTAKVKGKEIRLDNDLAVRTGVLFGRKGKAAPMERPMQLFTRWYGFSLTFPGVEVFEGK